VDIILRSRLFGASYSELNDPMEGYYYYQDGELNETVRDKIEEEKNSLRITSLSRINDNHLMWAHYADGHKGVAIGISIDGTAYDVRDIKYDGSIVVNGRDYSSRTAIDILSHKLAVWKYEEEIRVFQRGRQYIDVKIIEIILGHRVSNQNVGLVQDLISKVNPRIKVIRAKNIFSIK